MQIQITNQAFINPTKNVLYDLAYNIYKYMNAF